MVNIRHVGGSGIANSLGIVFVYQFLTELIESSSFIESLGFQVSPNIIMWLSGLILGVCINAVYQRKYI